MSESRQPKVGDHVIFVDSKAARHNALLTAVHGWGPVSNPHPAVNLVYVTANDEKRDPYGHQLERSSSVVHRSHQSAAGMYWDFDNKQV